MACNDVRGQHVIDACARIGLAVPEEVAVIGVDDDEVVCELCDPPLSSVIANPERVGYVAAELLDRLMAGEPAERPGGSISPLGIATRQSTDVPAIDDPDVAPAVKLIREDACKGITVEDLLGPRPVRGASSSVGSASSSALAAGADPPGPDQAGQAAPRRHRPAPGADRRAGRVQAPRAHVHRLQARGRPDPRGLSPPDPG